MNEAHMLENADIFGFEISQEDMWMISCMPQDDLFEELEEELEKVTDYIDTMEGPKHAAFGICF